MRTSCFCVRDTALMFCCSIRKTGAIAATMRPFVTEMEGNQVISLMYFGCFNSETKSLELTVYVVIQILSSSILTHARCYPSSEKIGDEKLDLRTEIPDDIKEKLETVFMNFTHKKLYHDCKS